VTNGNHDGEHFQAAVRVVRDDRRDQQNPSDAEVIPTRPDAIRDDLPDVPDGVIVADAEHFQATVGVPPHGRYALEAAAQGAPLIGPAVVRADLPDVD
jgi:hypothetical protein